MTNLWNQSLDKLKRKLIEPIWHKIYQEKILAHRLLFCINSGRSGSHYLSKILGTAKEVVSYHEQVPSMNGDYLNLINKEDYLKTFSKRRYKSHVLKNILLKLPPQKVYCDTSHMFIKTFFDVIVKDFTNLEVIILRRNLANVLKSFIELGYFSPENKNWPLWMSSPNAKTAAIQCIDSDDKLDQYDLSIAYLIDIEARAIRFKKQYPYLKTYEIRLEAMNQFETIEQLFQALNITVTDQTKKIYSQKINQRLETKNKYSQDKIIDLSFCQERIDRYLEKAHSLNIPIPPTLPINC
jgi:hypothetical protein